MSPRGRNVSAAALALLLGMGGAPPLFGEDRAVAEANRVVALAEAAGQARWAALTAEGLASDPPVTWALWGRADGAGGPETLGSGGLKLGTPWGSVQGTARQNPAPLLPGGAVTVEVSLSDGQPGGRWTAWNRAQDLAAGRARLEAVSEVRRTADRALARLKQRLDGWLDRRVLAQNLEEARARFAEAQAAPDRVPPRERERYQALADTLDLQARELASLPADDEEVQALLSQGPSSGQPRGGVRPAHPLFRARPEVLESEQVTKEAAFAQARRAAASWPLASLGLEAQQAVWGQGTPVLGAELRVSGSFGPPSPPVPPPVPLCPFDEGPKALRTALAAFRLDRAWTALGALEADQSQARNRRAQTGLADAPAERKEALALVLAEGEVLKAWWDLVAALVDQALSPQEAGTPKEDGLG